MEAALPDVGSYRHVAGPTPVLSTSFLSQNAIAVEAISLPIFGEAAIRPVTDTFAGNTRG